MKRGKVVGGSNLRILQGGKTIEHYLLPKGRVDAERFIVETIADFRSYGDKIRKADEPLITVLYHLNYLPEHLMPDTFQYRHSFRDVLYRGDAILGEEISVVYYKLLSTTLAKAEAVARAQTQKASPDDSRSLALLYHFDGEHFDELREMMHQDVLFRCSSIEPPPKTGKILAEGKEHNEEYDDGPESCW